MIKNSLKNICMVRLSAIGDVTLCLPIINSIKHSIPDAHITWITSPSSFALLDGIEGVEFILFNKGFGPKAYLDLRKKLDGRHFDCLLALQASWRANFIYPMINSPLKIGFDTIRSKDCQHLFTNKKINYVANQHLLDSYFSFLDQIGVDTRIIEWNLPIQEERLWAKILIGSIQSKTLLINPAASKEERIWGIDRYINVIKEAKKRWNLHVILTGGNNLKEISIGKKISEEIKSGITNLTGKTTIKQFAALTELADLVLSPDTSAIHLATAAKTPVIGLYAVAPPDITGPYSNDRFVINKFPDAVRTYLKRDPLNLRWGTRVHTQRAMDLISVSDVLEKIEEVMSLRGGREPDEAIYRKGLLRYARNDGHTRNNGGA